MEVAVKSVGEKLVVIGSENLKITYKDIYKNSRKIDRDGVSIAMGQTINSRGDLKKFYSFMITKVKEIRYSYKEFEKLFDMKLYDVIIYYNDYADGEFTIEFKNSKNMAKLFKVE